MRPSADPRAAWSAGCSAGCERPQAHRRSAATAGRRSRWSKPNKRAPDRPKLPLVDEKEPDDDVATRSRWSRAGIRAARRAHGRSAKPVRTRTSSRGWRRAWPARRHGRVPLCARGAGGRAGARPGARRARRRRQAARERQRRRAGRGEIIPNVGVEPAHTYYLRVHEAGAPKGDREHAYELTVQTWPAPAGDEREPNDDPAHATPVKLSNGTSGEASGFFGASATRTGCSLSLAGVPARRAGDAAAGAGAGGGVAPSDQGDRARRQDAVRRGARRQERGAAAAQRQRRPRGGGRSLIALRAAEGRTPEARWCCASAWSRRSTAPSASRTTTSRTPRLALAGGARRSERLSLAGRRRRLPRDAAPRPRRADRRGRGRRQGGPQARAARRRRQGVGARRRRAGWAGRELPPAKAGEALVRVSGRARDTAFDAPYRLTATVTPAAARRGARAQRQRRRRPRHGCPASATMRGRLAPRGDEDWFRFAATAAPAGAPLRRAGAGERASIVDEGR